MCKFSTFYIGEMITIQKLNWGYCNNCNGDMPNFLRGTYQGHLLDNGIMMDVFRLNPGYICPSCKFEIVEYREYCEDGISILNTKEIIEVGNN